MCCRTSVYPLEPDLATSILTIGQFRPKDGAFEDQGFPLTWQRAIDEEGTFVTVSLAGGVFDITISPSISSFDHHIGKRITAGVYFEIAAKYAEKIGGEIVQRATVTGCRSDDGSGLIVARYPSMPMSFEHICHGFQAVLLPGYDQLSA